MAGSEVRSDASVTTPSRTSRPAASASRVCGAAPMPTITASAPIRVPSASRAPVAFPPLTVISATRTPSRRSTPCSRCRPGEYRRDLRAEDVQQRQFGRFQDGDVDPGGAGGSRHLQADPAGADDEYAGRGGEGVPDPVAVGGPAQVQHAVGVRAGQRQAARDRSGGQQQPAVGQVPAAGQRHLPAAPVDPGDRRAEQQLDARWRRTSPGRARRLCRGSALPCR